MAVSLLDATKLEIFCCSSTQCYQKLGTKVLCALVLFVTTYLIEYGCSSLLHVTKTSMGTVGSF